MQSVCVHDDDVGGDSDGFRRARYMLHFMVDSRPVVDLGVWPLVIAGLGAAGICDCHYQVVGVEGSGGDGVAVVCDAAGDGRAGGGGAGARFLRWCIITWRNMD